MEILIWVIGSFYLIDILLLFYYGLHCYIMVYLYRKYFPRCESTSYKLPEIKEWPVVSVQLPIYNEYYVLERLLEAVTSLDYPKEKLHIQILDDSTDETKDLARKKTEEYKKLGFDIEHIHREHREGHKAGALREGLKRAKGEFIAIFDADFIPHPQFLKKSIPFFYQDPNLGMVQTRWGHTNAEYSILTKSQSIGIDGHFTIEQVARNGSGLWMNFNGTAGIWRKECILDAGNWQSDTLTEDFDISYRAELKGWRFQYLQDVLNPQELPATISAYKSQQYRWCKGSMQTARKLIPKILKASLPWKIKAEAITHLLGYSVHPLMVLNILLTLPLLLLYDYFPKVSEELIFSFAVVFSVGTLGPLSLYLVSQKRLYPNEWKKRALFLPILMMIGVGIAVSNTKAWVEGLFGKNRGDFVRTPKLAITGKEKNKEKVLKEKGKYLRSVRKFNWVILLEIFMGFYSLLIIWVGFLKGKYLVAPFMLIYAGGFFYIGIGSLKEYLEEKTKESALLRRLIPAYR